jgi:hypothetical protein
MKAGIRDERSEIRKATTHRDQRPEIRDQESDDPETSDRRSEIRNGPPLTANH